MEVVALDSSKIIALMIAGGAFALAGLWLLFRPQIEGHAAVIKLFGMEFQASSAGLLVFLVAAGFLATPIIVPEKRSIVTQPGTPGAKGGPVVPIIVPEGGSEVSRTIIHAEPT